jgi:hypothetical protein
MFCPPRTGIHGSKSHRHRTDKLGSVFRKPIHDENAKALRWSFKDDRQLIEVAKAAKSMNVIAPKSILSKRSS